MSKFEYMCFMDADGIDLLAVNKEKYTKEEAIKIAKRELDYNSSFKLAVAEDKYYVRHRAGRNIYGELYVGWYLEEEQYKRSCPVYVFKLLRKEGFKNGNGGK